MKDNRKDSTDYERIADKVGLVPNVRKKDNLYQGAAVLAATTVGSILGHVLMGGWPVGALVGGLGGLVAGGLVSGVVLMIIGLMRK